jgi:hypothetical protein
MMAVGLLDQLFQFQFAHVHQEMGNLRQLGALMQISELSTQEMMALDGLMAKKFHRRAHRKMID